MNCQKSRLSVVLLVVCSTSFQGCRSIPETVPDSTLLHKAAGVGYLDAVQGLLEEGAEVNARADCCGGTPMHHAAVGGHVEVVEFLLARGAKVKVRNRSDYTPLHRAARYGHVEVVQVLLDNGALVDARQKDDLTPLFFAANYGHTNTVAELLLSGANPQAADDAGLTPLHAAALSGSTRIMQLMCDSGADVDLRHSEGITPLHLAAQKGHNKVVAYLIIHGADVNAVDSSGTSALHHAAVAGDVEIAELLLRHGADVNASSADGHRPLHLAIIKDQREMVDRLLASGADISARNNEGLTPLHIAALHGTFEIAEVLIKSGADLTARGKDGFAVGQIASSAGHTELAAYLSRGITPNEAPSYDTKSVIDSPNATVSMPNDVAKNAANEMPTFDERAIVVVSSQRYRGKGMGQGFVLAGSGLVVTAAHVVCERPETGGQHLAQLNSVVVSQYYGDIFEANVVALDHDADLALLHVSWPGHPSLDLVTDDELHTALEVIVASIQLPEDQESIGSSNGFIDTERLAIRKLEDQNHQYFQMQLNRSERVGEGWSGGPMILPESGKVAGVFNVVLGRESSEDVVNVRILGASATQINSLVHDVNETYTADTHREGQSFETDMSRKAFSSALKSIHAKSNKDYSSALTEARKLVALRPWSPLAHLNVASCSYRLKKTSLSEKHFGEALGLDASSVNILSSYATFLSQEGRSEEALAVYRRALAIDPYDSATIVNLLGMLGQLGKSEWEEGEVLARRAVEREPFNSYFWINLGGILYRLEKKDEAIDASLKAVTLNPSFGRMRGQLAHQLEGARRLDEAEAQFRKLLEFEPENPVVWLWFAEFLAKHREDSREEALETIETAISLNDSGKVSRSALKKLHSQMQAALE